MTGADAGSLDLAEIGGLPAKAVNLVGETTLAHLKTRPDYAVTVNNALVGFIEVKAPGKGADPRQFVDDHDKGQWNKLKSLPNLIYTDGNAFSLWRDGQIEGTAVHLDGSVETSGANLAALDFNAFAKKLVDRLDATDNVLSLTVAQFRRLGSVALTSSDAVTLPPVAPSCRPSIGRPKSFAAAARVRRRFACGSI